MDKNEILEKSREENKNQDEREKFAIAKASQKATYVGAFLFTAYISRLRVLHCYSSFIISKSYTSLFSVLLRF